MKESPSHAKECKDYVKQNVFVIFDSVTWNHERGEDCLVIYVYDGGYLTCGLCRELTAMSDKIESAWYSINNMHNGSSSDHHQFRNLSVIRVSKYFSIIDVLHDLRRKFNYVTTMGGVMVNKQIQWKEEKKTYIDTSYSLFSFFMVVFCQSFKNELRFNTDPIDCIESIDGIGRFFYQSNFDMCGDSHVHCTLSYKADVNWNPNFNYEGSRIPDVYKSLIADITVDMNRESNGYYPGVKGFIQSTLCMNIIPLDMNMKIRV